MDAVIAAGPVAGRVRAPPSKSYTHRALLAAGYAEEARVEGPLWSADTRATARAVEAFGGSVTEIDPETRHDPDIDEVARVVTGFAGRPTTPTEPIDCANSGTTMRLATATAALADGRTRLTGDASLRERPQGPLLDAIEQLGGTARSETGDGRAPLVVEGPISGGTAKVPGDVSSQFVSALLFAGAATEEGIRIDLTSPLRSAPYVAMTREVLSAFEVETETTEAGFGVPGAQAYRREAPYRVPGDFSSASYVLAAGALASPDGVTVEGLYPSEQGDEAIVEYVRRMGADVDRDAAAGTVTVSQAPLSGIEVSVADTPDLLPTLAVLGAAAGGTTRLTDVEHVRYKETDRVAAMAQELSALGAAVEEREFELIVDGEGSDLEGTAVSGHGDHRIVMALSVAGLVAAGETTVTDAEDVDVSFPGFFDALYALGATIERP